MDRGQGHVTEEEMGLTFRDDSGEPVDFSCSSCGSAYVVREHCIQTTCECDSGSYRLLSAIFGPRREVSA